MSAYRRMQIDPYLSCCKNLKSKWIKDLNVKRDPLNLIGEKVGNTLEHIGTGDDFLNRTLIVIALRSAINKWDFMQLKSFYNTKNTINQTKQQLKEWQQIFISSTSDRRLIYKIYNKLQKLAIRNKRRSQVVVAHAFNPSTWEAEEFKASLV